MSAIVNALRSFLKKPTNNLSLRARQPVNQISNFGTRCKQGVILGLTGTTAIVEWDSGGVSKEPVSTLVALDL